MDKEASDTLLDGLPPMGWEDFSTKQDVEMLGNLLRAEINTAIAELRGEIYTAMAELRGEVLAAIKDQAASAKDDSNALLLELTKHTRTLTLGILGAMVAVAGLPPLIDKLP